MSRPLSHNYASLCLFALCILLTLSACSGSSSGGDAQQSGDSGTNTGGVSFQLVWQQTSSGAKAAQLTPLFNSCNDYSIGTIAATVSNGTATVSSSFPCSAHQGLISGVPAGTNYTLKVYGIASGSTTTTWSGQTSPITVTTGQITNAGTIAMNYIGSATLPPNVTLIGPHSSPTNTTNVPVTDRIDIVFDKPMAISTMTTTNITLLSGGTTTISGKVIYSGMSYTASFIPSANLAPDSTQYVLKVVPCGGSGPCITDTGGHQLTITSKNTNTFTTEAAPSGIPAAPSGVTATAGNGQVTLDWLATSGSTSYKVYYGLSSVISKTTNSAEIFDVRAPSVQIGLTNNTTYYYIVTAVNGFGESPASAETSTTPTFPTTNPLPPASVTVTYDSPIISQNTISWPAVTGATSYNLYWSPMSITPDTTTADHVIRNVTSPYIHTGVTSGQTYCYMVTAMNSNGESGPSMQYCNPGGVQIIWN